MKSGGVPMSIEELKDEALRMSKESRAYIARELLASLDDMSESEIDELCLLEAVRRDEELDNGTARSYPADEVLARARARRK
jgi:hypothetical protein